MKNIQHNTFVNRNKPCFYGLMEQNGFPRLETIAFMDGSDLHNKFQKWLKANWMYQTDVMYFFTEVIKMCEGKTQMSWSVRNQAASEVVQALFTFMNANFDTLKHLGTAFQMPKPEDIKPFVSPELLTLSFQERQEILNKNREARLEEVKE